MDVTERDWSLDSKPFERKSDPLQLEIRIRFSIFFITGVCAGLPALVWSVRDIIHHRKNGLRISIFIILLLLTDFLELFLNPYILIKLLLNDFSMDWTCRIFLALQLAMKDCGFLLNQLVALEGILSVKYPQFTASVFSSLCFRIVHILVFICVIIGVFFWERARFWLVLFLLSVSVMLWIIACGALCCAERHYHRSRKSDHHIVVIFIFTLLVFYLRYIFIIYIGIFNRFIFQVQRTFWTILFNDIPGYVRCLRLISDPLLCVLVCRQNLSLQTSQKPEGLV